MSKYADGVRRGKSAWQRGYAPYAAALRKLKLPKRSEAGMRGCWRRVQRQEQAPKAKAAAAS
jgi:hypothetical protein